MADAFGADPSILLARTQSGAEPLGASFERMLRMQAQRQQMAQTGYEQQRQRSLADLVSQNAGVYEDPAAKAYALGGYGEQAAQAQQAAMMRQHAALQQQQQQMAMQESAAKLEGVHRLLTASKLKMAAKSGSQEEFDKIASSVPESYGLRAGDPNWQTQAEAFGQSTVTPEQDAQNEAARLRIEAMRGSQPIVRDNALGQVIAVDPKTREAVIVDANKKPVRPAGGAGGAGAGHTPTTALSKDALDIVVNKAVRDGDMPKFGSGPRGEVQRNNFLNRLAEMYPGADLATAHADYRAKTHNLQEATTQGGAQDVKEEKALADIQVLRGTMKGLIDTRSPLVNAVGRAYQERSGDPNYAAFRTAREMTLPTINSVVNSGQMSVGAREEVKDLLKKDDSIASMDKALEIIELDMARSREATHKRIHNARSSIATLPGTSTATSSEDGPVKLVDAKGNPFTAPNRAVAEKAIASKKYKAAP